MSDETKRHEEMTLAELEAAADQGDPGAIESLQRLADRPEVRVAMEAIIEQTRQLHESVKASATSFSVTMHDFYESHKKACDALKDKKSISIFARSLAKEDIYNVLDGKTAASVWKQLQTAKQLEIKEAPIDDIETAYFNVLRYLSVGEAVALYEYKDLNIKKIYRTKAKAKSAGAITEAPTNLVIPTLSSYQYSMSLYKDGGAYLQPLNSMDGLRFESGRLYFDDARMKEVSEAELRDLRTKKGIEEIDLPGLRFYYSILFNQFRLSNYKVLQDIIPISASILTGRNDPNKQDVDAAIAKVQSYHNIMGVVKGTRNGRPTESYYQVLNFEYYDAKKNIIAFSSPYMNYVINTIYKLSIRKNRDGKPKLKRNSTPLLKVSHSFLIDSSIRKERNKAAAENVVILVTLIEQAGGNLPNLKASTLVERNVQLAERLENDSLHKAQLLKRTFTKTWELMKTKTSLAQRYKNLRVSTDKNNNGVLLTELDPKDPAFIPTVRNLKDLCFYFPHDGKE